MNELTTTPNPSGTAPAVFNRNQIGAAANVGAVAIEQEQAVIGFDAVIAQGLEAGGHRGMFLSDDLTTQVGTMALLPQIVRAVDVPVIATGGIATPEGVSAAFRLGASAVQAGTAYLLADEATTSPLHRDAIRSPAARQRPARTFSGSDRSSPAHRV